MYYKKASFPVIIWVFSNIGKLPNLSVSGGRLAKPGNRRGGQSAAVTPTQNLKVVTSHAVSVQNTPKFSLAPSALGSPYLKLILKRRKNCENFCLSLWCAEKYVISVSPRGFAPLYKNFCGRPCLAWCQKFSKFANCCRNLNIVAQYDYFFI